MFGEFNAIREELPHFFLDYQERPLDAETVRWTDRVLPDGTWSGNLYDFFRKIIGKLTADLKVPFRLSDGVQRQDETRVHEALREALVNTLIHADYEAPTSILVVKRPDAFVFRNPGQPRLPPEQIREGGLSDCRNRALQRMFLMVGLGETAGSGFSRILRAWREESWRAPALRVGIEPEVTTLDLPTRSLLSDELVADLHTRLGSTFDTLGSDERIAVATAAAEGSVTNQRLREQTRLHARDATILLRKLVDAGMLQKHGERSDAWYSLRKTEELPLFAEARRDETVATPSGETSQASDESSAARDETSAPRDDTSGAIGETSALARLRTTRKAPAALIQAAILEACRDRFLDVETIARTIGRAETTVRNRYLRPLVATGRLVLRFPSIPHHPHQAYRTSAAVREGAGRDDEVRE